MARGWESKSVEAQQAEAAESRTTPKRRLSFEQANQLHQIDGLQLSRRRVLHQLETVQNPRHREMLKQALADLDLQIKALESSP